MRRILYQFCIQRSAILYIQNCIRRWRVSRCSNSENGSEPLAGAFEIFSDEPAFLLADTALGPPDKNDTDLNDSDEDQEGDEPDELIPFTIPFNASHDSDWRPDRQLATYMLANG